MILNPYAIVIDAYVTLGGIKPSASSYADHKAYINASGQAAYITALEGIFAGKTNADMATTVLTNLGLTAAFTAAQGEAYFAANAGSRVQAALSLTSALANYSGTDTVLVAAKTTHNQVASNAYAYASVATNTVDSAVSATSSNTGQTFTLTTGTDALSGTNGNDQYSGVISGAGATGTTAAPGDLISGGDGTDTLTISVAGANAGPTDYTLSAVRTDGVEKIFVSNFETTAANHTIDASLMSGVEVVGMTSSSATGDTIFSGLNSIVGAEMRNGAGDLTVTYGAAAVAGTADTQAVTVSNLSAGTFTAQGAETIAITTDTLKSTLTDVVSTSLKTVTVAGDKDLAITNALTATTIDAATATGGVTVKLGAADQKVTGGTGADVIDSQTNLTNADTVNGGAGVDTLKISTGAALTVGTAAAKGVLYGVSNVEVLDVASTNDAAAIDLTSTVGVTTLKAAANVYTLGFAGTNETATDTVTFTLNGTTYTTDAITAAAATDSVEEVLAAKISEISGFSATAGTDSVTITATSGEAVQIGTFVANNVSAGGGTISIDSATGTTGYTNASFTNLAAGQTVDIYSADAVTASLKDASGTEDSLTINLATTAADKGFAKTIGTVTANNIETLNLDATGMTDGKVTTVSTLTGAAAKILNITGDSDVTISAFTSSAALVTIDGSTSTGDLNLAAAPAAKDQSIKTGSGNDTIVMAGLLTAKDTIDGGANSVIAGGTTVGKDLVTASGAIGTVTEAAALKIANVENIENATGGGAATYIDAAGITGAESIAFSSTSGTVKLTNLAAGTAIGLGIGADEAASTFDLALADATGTSDTLTLDYADTIDLGTTNVLKIAGVETLAISATKESGNATVQTLTNTNMAATNIVVTNGVAEDTLALGTLNAATTNVDASAYKGILTATTAATGAVTVSANGAVANSITTGAGADTITLAGKLGTAINVIAGGAGADVLNATANNAATDFTSVSAVETINLTVAAGTAVGMGNTVAQMAGFNAATTVNLLGGDSLSTFKNGTTGIITDAAKTIDASSFGGAIDLVLAVNALDADMVIKGGSSATDKVTTSINTDTTGEVVKSMTGVETLVINSEASDSNARIDLTNVTGLTTVQTTFTGGGTLSQIALDKLASGVTVKVLGAITNDNLVIDLADKAAADNALSLELTGAGVAVADDILNIDAAGVETLNIKASNTTAATLDLAGVAATAATGNVAVNITGAGTLALKTLSALTNVVDANAATGAITLASADRAATAMTITTGQGADSVAMRHANDVLNGGLGTDTLVLTPNFVLGGVQIDLSSTTDQITTFNGSANAAVQVGFENVDASGVTGSFGADITAIKTGSNIIGTANSDQITGGAGNDTIEYKTVTHFINTTLQDSVNGGAGSGDTIKLSVGNNAITVGDAVVWSNFSNVEKIVSAANSAAVSLDLDVTAQTAGINEIDLTLTTNATSNVVKLDEFTSTGVTVKGGTGVDTITGGAGADTITGGLGADVIVGGGGNDSIILTEGVAAIDKVTVGDVTAAGIDTITGFAINSDLIIHGLTEANAAYTNDTARDLSGSATLLAAAQASATAVNGASAGDFATVGDVVAFTYGTKKYVVISAGANSLVTAGEDMIVEIVGVDMATIDINDFAT